MNIAKVVTYMTRADAMAPIVALEATVTTGRTIQAYKRGGMEEARERAIEETTGAVVWIGGVKSLNALGDKILGKILVNNPSAKFDVGTDKILRRPFDNFMSKANPKGFSPKQVAIIKAIKVLSSVVLADMFIGLVVPKINQGLTKKISKKNKTQTPEQQNKSQKPSFKGGFSAINVFTNAIENSNTGKLLSTDAGLVSGRMYSARTKEERKEIAIRDIGSIYFYMWAQGHVGNVLNFVESGKTTRLNPTTTQTFNDYMVNFLNKNGSEMTVDEFKKAMLGDNSKIKLPENIKFETGELSSFNKFINNFKSTKTEPLKVVKVSELEKIITDKDVLSRIKEMSNLQPQRLGESVVTKQQIIDAMNKCEINNPKFLDKVFVEFTDGASKNEYKYVANSSLYNLKGEMEQYINTICKSSKNGKVDKKLLETVKKKNLAFNGINFIAGFVFAATFLSTLIPKFQYWYTKKTTGVDAFPGTYDYTKNNVA